MPLKMSNLDPALQGQVEGGQGGAKVDEAEGSDLDSTGLGNRDLSREDSGDNEIEKDNRSKVNDTEVHHQGESTSVLLEIGWEGDLSALRDVFSENTVKKQTQEDCTIEPNTEHFYHI